MKQFVLTFTCALMAARAATISGTVKGADGSVITAGVLTASRQSGGVTSRSAHISGGAPILPDGVFHLPPLADGNYQVCAQAPGSIWLNSCEWGQSGTMVSISSSQPSSAVAIVLRKGALVTVRVNDAAKLLTAHEGKSPGAHLLIGVTTDAHVFRGATVSEDPAGRTYRILVPFDRSVNLSAGSAFFKISDGVGRALPKFGNLIPVLIPSGQPPPTIVLNVAGLVSALGLP